MSGPTVSADEQNRCPVTDPGQTGNIADLPLPPGRRGFPIVGETLAFVRSPRDFIRSRVARYGRVFRTNLLNADTVYLIGPEANHWIFANEGKVLENRWNYAIRRLLGQRSVSMLTGEAHRHRRRTLAPHFTRAAARTYAPWIQQLTDQHLQRWLDEPGDLKVVPAMRALAFEIATVLLFGDRHTVDMDFLSQQYSIWTAGMFVPVPVALPFTTFGKALRAKDRLIATIRAAVDRRLARAADQDSEPSSDDILAALLSARDEDGRPLSPESVVDEIMVQLFAGHDTTVTALSNIMFLLAQNPDALDRGRRALGQAVAGDQPRDPAKLDAIPILDQILYEGMRSIPPISGAFRVTTEDVEYQGYRIPKGWTVGLSIAGTHHDSHWKQTAEFCPERFAPPRDEHKQAPFAYIPFGGGHRTCVGQHIAMTEMRIVLATLLQNYRWELSPGQDLRFTSMPFPLPRSGLRVRFLRR